jgi:hypothetical protein
MGAADGYRQQEAVSFAGGSYYHSFVFHPMTFLIYIGFIGGSF